MAAVTARPGFDTDDPWTAIETCYARGWTDGLPVVPPTEALIDAMLDFSGPMRLGAGEWLTVAARDNARRDTLAPQDPYEEIVTVVLRIKGADLQEYRSAKIDKAEARKRVKVGEF